MSTVPACSLLIRAYLALRRKLKTELLTALARFPSYIHIS